MPEVEVKDLTVSFRVYHDRLPQIKDYLLGLLSKKKNTLEIQEWLILPLLEEKKSF